METLDQKTERNCRVQARYDELMREGKHGHYETVFRVVREEVEAEREQQAAQIAEKGAEIARLTECLSKANANHEHFARAWYLRGDEVEALRAALANIAKLVHCRPLIDARTIARAALRQEQPT